MFGGYLKIKGYIYIPDPIHIITEALVGWSLSQRKKIILIIIIKIITNNKKKLHNYFLKSSQYIVESFL